MISIKQGIMKKRKLKLTSGFERLDRFDCNWERFRTIERSSERLRNDLEDFNDFRHAKDWAAIECEIVRENMNRTSEMKETNTKMNLSVNLWDLRGYSVKSSIREMNCEDEWWEVKKWNCKIDIDKINNKLN
jgi:hypothetical protein